MRALIVLVSLTVGCHKEPDLSLLPYGLNDWCCEDDICFATRDIAGFPRCLNIWMYGTHQYVLDMGHTIDGKFITCNETLREAMAANPKVIEQRLNVEYGQSPTPYVDSCLPHGHFEPRDKAYVVTSFDRKEEVYLFYAYKSEYACEKSRETDKNIDSVSQLSDCQSVPAKR